MTIRSAIWIALAAACVAPAQEISAARISQHVRFLSSDLLEGRGVGARGGQLATQYIAGEMALAGVRPADTWFQNVPLVNVRTTPETQIRFTSGDRRIELAWLDDYAGLTGRQSPEVVIDSDVVFAGHAITANEFRWDDFKDMDVRGKTLLIFTNEPRSDDKNLFDGPALTYYGRWTYKFEEARRRGAAAVLIIHTPGTAGYGWDVVRSSWGAEQPQLPVTAADPGLAFAGWITGAAAERLLEGTSHSVPKLLDSARLRTFRPIDLGLRLQARIVSTTRPVQTRNVVGMVRGSDPELAKEVVVYTAHWDHLGIGPEVAGDRIYNGAVDNATGCGILLEIARAWAATTVKPRRSALFVATAAEEGGLLGAQHFVQHPLAPLKQISAALNLDSYFPFGRTSSLILIGAREGPYWNLARDAAGRSSLALQDDPHPEAGARFRLDQFPFAQAGVPAISIHLGDGFAGKTAEESDRLVHDYGRLHYHQPSDEFQEDWDFGGLEQVGRYALRLGQMIADR